MQLSEIPIVQSLPPMLALTNAGEPTTITTASTHDSARAAMEGRVSPPPLSARSDSLLSVAAEPSDDHEISCDEDSFDRHIVTTTLQHFNPINHIAFSMPALHRSPHMMHISVLSVICFETQEGFPTFFAKRLKPATERHEMANARRNALDDALQAEPIIASRQKRIKPKRKAKPKPTTKTTASTTCKKRLQQMAGVAKKPATGGVTEGVMKKPAGGDTSPSNALVRLKSSDRLDQDQHITTHPH